MDIQPLRVVIAEDSALIREVRHLVLPGDLAGTEDVLGWLAADLSPIRTST